VRIYNGAVPVARVAKEQWPQKDGFTLVYVGRLEPVKNHALLLSAFRAALWSMPGLRLWMVGNGSERKALESLATELGIDSQITFWGQQLDVAPFFSAADAFIMSSKSEGLPMSLLQAFSLGLPAIVTDVGGMAEVVRLAQAGSRYRYRTRPDGCGDSSAGGRRCGTAAILDQCERRVPITLYPGNYGHAYMNLYRNTPRAAFPRPESISTIAQ